MNPEVSLRFEALAEPTRREILEILADGELSATQIAQRVDHIGRTAVSSHLRVLRSAGLVSERRSGRYRWYSINPMSAESIMSFLTGVYRSTLDELKLAT